MIKKIILFLTFLAAITSPTLARELEQSERSLLQNLAREIISEGFPTLEKAMKRQKKKLLLKFYSIRDPQYFMESNFTVKRFLLGTPQYRIGVNPLIFDLGISREALKGVLAHELTHTEDYFNGSTLRTIIPIGIKVMIPKARAKYERKTDTKVVMKGFGENLRSYRIWQYKHLTPDQLKRKKTEYLSPEEIEDLMQDLSNRVEDNAS